MSISVSTKVRANPKFITQSCTEAEHQVALQAERDARPYIPQATGRVLNSARVVGNTITYRSPYVRAIYFGNVMVDINRGIAGFKNKQGEWKSWKGSRKVRSARKIKFNNGGELWFYKAKKANEKQWIKIAKGVMARGKPFEFKQQS